MLWGTAQLCTIPRFNAGALSLLVIDSTQLGPSQQRPSGESSHNSQGCAPILGGSLHLVTGQCGDIKPWLLYHHLGQF